jgi:Protein of unknown function (DUF2807).
MIKSTLILLFAGLLFSANAQKVINDANAEARQVSDFHAIHVSNAFTVTITQSNEEKLVVSANEKEYLPNIVTKVENGVLYISYEERHKWWPKNRKLRAYVSLININEIKATGATDVKIEGQLKSSNLKLDLRGASDLKGELIVDGSFDAHLSGASDLNINGSANDVKIEASGASDVKAFDFKSNTCIVDASGACSVHISVDKELSARLSGASSVSYKGAALIRDIKTSGASNISKKS